MGRAVSSARRYDHSPHGVSGSANDAEVRISVRRYGIDDKMFQPIDDEERRIMESLETALIDSAPTRDDERRKAIEAAKNTLKKTERINLRLTKRDLVGIKAAAKEEEIPYQTLIAHLIRKYLEERVRQRLGERAS